MDNIKIDKRMMLRNLPFEIDEFVIRELEREDFEHHVNWPEYPSPHEMFNSSLRNKPNSARRIRWEKYCADDKIISLVVDHEDSKTIGKFSFVGIDWENHVVENMGIRLHPHWCDKGNGTKILKGITDWCFSNGIKRIQFDVLSTNLRAIKSYKKAGYTIFNEIQREGATFYMMESKV